MKRSRVVPSESATDYVSSTSDDEPVPVATTSKTVRTPMLTRHNRRVASQFGETPALLEGLPPRTHRKKATRQVSNASAKSSASSAMRRLRQAEYEAAQAIADAEEEELLAELKKKSAGNKKTLAEKRLAFEKAVIEEEANDSQDISDEDLVLEDLLRIPGEADSQTKVNEWNDSHEQAKETGGDDEVKPQSEIPCEKSPVQQATATVTEKSNLSSMDLLLQAMTELTKRVTPGAVTEGDKMEKFIARQSTPRDLPIFSGKAEEWPMFISQFENSTKLCGYNNAENMARLQKCLKDDALDSVRESMTAPENLDEVMNTLKTTFGEPQQIIRTLIQKVKNLPSPTESKPKSLIAFSNAVRNLVSTMTSLKCEKYLNNPQLTDDLIVKLPPNLRLTLGAIIRKDPNFTLKTFSDWIKEIAEAASLVSFATTDDKPCKANVAKKNDHRQGKGHAVFTTTEQEVPSSSEKNTCLFCSKKNHSASECRSFAKQTEEERWKWVAVNKLCFCCLEKNHQVVKCTKKKVCGVDGCQRSHHPLLHNNQSEKEDMVVKTVGNVNKSNGLKCNVLLRVVPVVLRGPLGEVNTYALFDEAAMTSMMDAKLADHLGLLGPKAPFEMQWTNGMTALNENSRVVKVEIRDPTNNKYYLLDRVRTDEKLRLPRHTVNAKALKEKWIHLRAVKGGGLNDVQPTILLGQDYIYLTVAREIVEGSPQAPIATRSKLGWAIHGKSGMQRGRVDNEFTCHVFHTNELEEIHDMVKDSFRTENFGVKVNENSLLSKEEKRVQTITEATTRKVGDKWETGLLWKSDDVKLPESKKAATRRLYQIERKMDSDKEFGEIYFQKIEDYFKKGYAVKLSPAEAAITTDKTWYLPHFAVYHPNKPGKPRLVFDAASKANGVSLNDMLLKGMDLLQPLTSVLFKFRQYEIAFCGDIREMFHQVAIRDEDKDSQRFLWRGKDRSRPPDVCRMNVMIFGAVSSPYSAQEVKNRNADVHKEEFPEAWKTIRENHYMDDCLDSTSTLGEAKKRIADVIEVHKRGGFEICKWVSNSPEVLRSLPDALVADSHKELTRDSDTVCERVLGLQWNPQEDNFTFNTSFKRISQHILNGERRPTMREVLKLTMSVYDPLGFLANFTIKARILLQDIWRSEIGWDDEISNDVHMKWDIWLQELRSISEFKLSRCYALEIPKARSIQLHVFSDASEKAFAAAGYIRVESRKGIETSLVCAKSRVAPLRPMSIPRLELQAALLASRLANTIRSEHDIKFDKTVFWCDSKTVLCWLRSDARKYKQFVALRIGEIEELTNIDEWRWIPSKENVSDEATRDNTPSEFSPGSRWVNGPNFLKFDETKWPMEAKEISEVGDEDELDSKKEFCGIVVETSELGKLRPKDFSRWTRLLRVTAYVSRFVNAFVRKWTKNKTLKEKINVESTKWLTVAEIRNAENWWLKRAQEDCFPEELHKLRNGKVIRKSSRLFKLSPILNANGLLVIAGRLAKSPHLRCEMKQPIILDRKHEVTKLIVNQFHRLAGHHGMERVVNDLRQKFWVIKMRAAVKKAWSDCMKCRIRNAVPQVPEMAPLPDFRVTRQIKPFSVTGLDYFGPYDVTIGRRHEKRYGALFTCMATRAVHVELAASLTTDSVIMALRRFIARRGTPVEILSDNGTNFRGAANELRKAVLELDEEKIHDELTGRQIVWRFQPPSAPHMSGAWERLVKSIKTAFKSVLTERAPREETLQTLMAEAEFTVNSRPLTFVSSDPNDPEALTPNHFLLGSSDGRLPPGQFDDADLCLRKQWRIAQRLADMFWRRWVSEYLPSLTRREKWHEKRKPLQVGDLVFIADGDMKRNCWPRGIVTAVYPGKDGQVRVADVRTQSGTFRRPVAKLCILDVLPDVDTPGGPSTEGGMSLSEREKERIGGKKEKNQRTCKRE